MTFSTEQFLKEFNSHTNERAKQGIPALALTAEQCACVVETLKAENIDDPKFYLDLLQHRVPPGVDPAAYIKAAFLNDVAMQVTECKHISPTLATQILGTMQGGYNVEPLVRLLDSQNKEVAEMASFGLKNTLLVGDAFNDVVKLSKKNELAMQVLQSWAKAEWLSTKPLPELVVEYQVFKVDGEVNTDDLSPATEAWSRPDIPLHALSMLKNPRAGAENAMQQIAEMKKSKRKILFCADTMGTGSSRKSATNSVLWHFGDDIPYVPNKRAGGACFGKKIAPIFYSTMEDAGAFPIEADVSSFQNGMQIKVDFKKGSCNELESGKELCTFPAVTTKQINAFRSGGRLLYIIGRVLTQKACDHLDMQLPQELRDVHQSEDSNKGFTLAQKMVGQACGKQGVRAGEYCEPIMSTVGSQDTTGPMTRDELKDLACLGFSADFVLQSFCHTAAYPRPVDIQTQHTLPEFFVNRGGVSLRPGDGIIHPWLNRMLLPDAVGTGGDSHTRFPLGISFPAGSGLVAFAAATGFMPLTMPESVLVKFTGEIQEGITLRDLVHAIPYVALKSQDLTLDKKNKTNVFSGRCLEITGLEDIKLEQAFEFADASAERSSSGCTVKLGTDTISEYLNSNIALIEWMIKNNYMDKKTLSRRVKKMREWLKNPKLLEADSDAEYYRELEVNMSDVTEPLLACPNDPDDIKTLSEVAGQEIDEVFIGSCMTNIGHFRAAAKLFDGNQVKTVTWIVPPTAMDQHELTQEGIYNIFGRSGARTEIPGCSLCMGNQARTKPGANVVSTSTRNFPNRMGDGANVYLASAEVSAITAILGRIPNVSEYREFMKKVNIAAQDIYKFLNFHQIQSYAEHTGTSDLLSVEQRITI